MKRQDYDRLVRMQASRRAVLKGAAGLGAALGTAGLPGLLSSTALAQDSLRAQLLQIPGVGKGSPTDADWQKVGELCLGLQNLQFEFVLIELRDDIPLVNVVA